MLKHIYMKYKEVVSYIFFGGVTTLINIGIYLVAYEVLDISNISSNIFAWFIATIFAFVTNRIYVFKSHVNNKLELILEIIRFFWARLFTGVLDLLIMFLSINILGLNAMILKVISNIVVIILNYIISKKLVFKV